MSGALLQLSVSRITVGLGIAFSALAWSFAMSSSEIVDAISLWRGKLYTVSHVGEVAAELANRATREKASDWCRPADGLHLLQERKGSPSTAHGQCLFLPCSVGKEFAWYRQIVRAHSTLFP